MSKQAMKRGSKAHGDYMRKLKMRADEDRELRAHFTQQCMMDAMALALHEVFGFGGKRIIRLCAVLMAKYNEILHLVCEDAENDEHFVYAKDTLDRALKQAYGRDFEVKPFAERYTPEGWDKVE